MNVPGITLIADDAQRTTLEALERAVREYGERQFIVQRGRPPISFRAFAGYVASACAGLERAGVRPGDHVAVMLPASPDVLVLWLALNALRAAPAMVNTTYQGDVLATVLADNCAAERLVIDATLLPHLAGSGRGAIAPRLTRFRHLYVSGAADETAVQPAVPWGVAVSPLESLLGDEGEQSGGLGALFDKERPSKDDLSVILATSGTTGPTKGVRCAHNHALHYAEVASAMRRLSARDVIYGYTPLFHADGLFGNALGALLTGATLLMSGPFHPRRFWRDAPAFGVTTFAYAGGMIAMLYHEAPPEGVAHQLRVAYGAPSPAHLAREFERRFGVRLIEGYGSTEVGIPTMAPWNDSRIERASAGIAVTGYDVIVAGPSGAALPAGVAGEIRVRPHHRTTALLGYYGRPDLDAQVWHDGWFCTGDLGRFDADGHLYFLGRMSDVVRRRGENVACQEVEAAVERCPGVMEAAAFGVPAEEGEEEVMVSLRVEAPERFDPAALVECARRQLPAFMVPRYVDVVPDFERSAATSKIRKASLIARGVTPTTWDARRHRW